MKKAKTKRTNDDFYHGIMAALDVIYIHDDPTATIAVEIIGTTDEKKLLAAAKRDGYYNIKNLRKTIREARWARKLKLPAK